MIAFNFTKSTPPSTNYILYRFDRFLVEKFDDLDILVMSLFSKSFIATNMAESNFAIPR